MYLPSFCQLNALLVLASFALFNCDSSAQEVLRLDRQLRRVSSRGRYVPPTPQQLEQCEQLFVRTLKGAIDSALRDEWAQLGFSFSQHRVNGENAIVVGDDPRSGNGWGYYLVYPDRLPGVVMQAPHSFADQFTRNVALRLERDGKFAAVAWNTVNRKTVDVAHELGHPFSAFTRALIRTYPGVAVIQMHGFSQQKRSSAAGASADLIVSNGDRFPEPMVRKVAVLLQSERAIGQTRLYPVSVQELGATTNVQAEMMRQHGSQRFIHFEMSRALRMRMVADANTRAVFLKNLATAVDESN